MLKVVSAEVPAEESTLLHSEDSVRRNRVESKHWLSDLFFLVPGSRWRTLQAFQQLTIQQLTLSFALTTIRNPRRKKMFLRRRQLNKILSEKICWSRFSANQTNGIRGPRGWKRPSWLPAVLLRPLQ
jgi:hypothetical protein